MLEKNAPSSLSTSMVDEARKAMGDQVLSAIIAFGVVGLKDACGPKFLERLKKYREALNSAGITEQGLNAWGDEIDSIVRE